MEAPVTFLLEQVKEVVIGYTDLISGVEKEFEQLTDRLNLFKAFLEDSAKTSKQENRLRELKRQIWVVFYDVEDTIDTCLTKAIEAKAIKAKSRRFGRPWIISKIKYNLAQEIISIRVEKLMPVFHEVKLKFPIELLMLPIADGSGGAKDPPKGHAPIRKNTIVGLKDEEKTIIGYLIQEKEQLEVIPIIGIPGQGKTTWALKIYESADICYHFPIRIWVYISQNFNSRDVFLQILRKFTSQDTSYLSDEELAESVRICLLREKFLLVLDDVWSDAWDEIKQVLPLDNGKGKVLITCRERDVGMHCSVDREPHKLRFLTDEESWTLLQYEVFGKLDACPAELMAAGRLVSDQCDGVPLTIAVVGGILADQFRHAAWPTIVASEWKKVAENISHAQSDKTQSCTNAVALSYDRLPNDLRHCFVYMGVFPEDYEIPVKMLYELWISEGFVQSRARARWTSKGFVQSGNTGRLEEAEEKLKDLISRNLVKVEKTNLMGEVKTCRVLNVIRAFCITKSQEEGLYQEIRKSNVTGALDHHELRKSFRLCIQSGLSKFLSETPDGDPHARSFMCFDKQSFELDQKYLLVIPDRFPKLRVLESRSIKFRQFPAKVTKLIHLRYLTLYIDNLIILPEAVSQLWNLQTLVVETKSGSITMKANMWRMLRLRHLRTKSAIVLDSKQEGEAGQNLQTLERLSSESCTEALFKKAKNLKTLGISGKLANILETGILLELHLLEKLKLVNSLANDEPLFSQPYKFPLYLKRLSLTNTFLEWSRMSNLAFIGTLEVLKLKQNAFIGVYWGATDVNFPSLRGLLISNADLVIWEASDQSFPHLRSLALKNCENLNEIPEAILKKLEILDINRVPESVVVSARRIFEQEKIDQEHKKGKSGMLFKLSIGH